MIRFKQKNLPKLLRQAFHEEAQKIKFPSHQQFWAKLQQQPGFTDIKKNAEEFFPKLKAKKRAGTGLFAFYKKYPQLTAVVAAGLLLAVILPRLIPLAGRAPLLSQEEIFIPDTGSQDETLAGSKDSANMFSEKAATFLEKRDENPVLKSFDLRGGEKELSPGQPPDPAKGRATWETAAVEEKGGTEERVEKGEDSIGPFASISDLQEGETPAPEKQIRNSQLGRNLQAAPAEQTFKDEEAFHRALKEARQLTTEEIWQVKSLPDNYNFQEGTITRMAEDLLQITQAFAGKAEDRFTIVQQFIKEEGESDIDTGPAITQGPAQTVQVGPYHGYLFQPFPEICTLTWLQEKSLVTLSGRLSKEMLHQILGTLESSPGE